ncbi:hypothetical protein [Paenibacillus sp. E194]|uniref:hypothetical protein n=1 Tax=Paenibacillus sp. E194 TaxID=1458845 RepID=UPI0012E03BB8|nr:hypothetical protein [Paenibacillus sp. E194]
MEKELISARISDYSKLPHLFLNKIKLMWAESSDAPYWSMSSLGKEKLANVLSILDHVSYFVIMLLLLFSILLLLFSRDTNHKIFFFLLLILAYFSVHLVIEIQTRYRYFIMPAIMIIQGYSCYILLLKIKKGGFLSTIKSRYNNFRQKTTTVK